MIALDTNVLVRLLIQDDEVQVAGALRALEPIWEEGKTAFVGDVVIAELSWVLEAAYGVPKRELLMALHRLAGDERFEPEDRSRLLAALRLYQAGKGDLADYLIGLTAQDRGAPTTLTFDRSLRGDPRFTVL